MFQPADLHLPVDSRATLVYKKSDIISSPLSAENNHSVCGFIQPGKISPRYYTVGLTLTLFFFSDQEILLGDADSRKTPTLHRDTRGISTFSPTHTRCGLRVVADHRFFNSVGGKNPKRTITYLVILKNLSIAHIVQLFSLPSADQCNWPCQCHI